MRRLAGWDWARLADDVQQQATFRPGCELEPYDEPYTPIGTWSQMAGSHYGDIPTDETARLIASDKVEGTSVYNLQGEKLGHVRKFMIDKYSGDVACAVFVRWPSRMTVVSASISQTTSWA